MSRGRGVAMVATLLTVLLSCEAPFTPPPEPPAPPAAPVEPRAKLSLATPFADDGAIVAEIHGLYVRAPRSLVDSNWMLAEGLDSITVRVVVIGEISAGRLLDFGFPDGATPASYSAAVVQAADRQGIPRASLEGYQLTISH